MSFGSTPKIPPAAPPSAPASAPMLKLGDSTPTTNVLNLDPLARKRKGYNSLQIAKDAPVGLQL